MLTRSATRWLNIVSVVALVTLYLLILAPPARAASAQLWLPFRLGQAWFVCQGYNTPESSHVDTQVNALDLSIAPTSASGTYGCVDGASASQGQTVSTPASGTVVRYCCKSPVDDMVCLDTDVSGSLMIGHMNGFPAIGTHLPAGYRLGAVNPPNTTTNEGGYSHIHIAAYSSNDCSGNSIPFDDADSTRFVCAPNLPSDSSTHQYYRKYLSRCGTASSNGNATLAIEFTLYGISPIGVDNNAPRHLQRTITVAVLNGTRQVVVTKTQTATYSSTNGDFTATVDLGPAWTAGKYFVTVDLSNSLAETMGQYSGSLYNLAAGKKTYLPRTPLFLGDVNGDNSIDVLDYNILLNCWQQTGCSPGSDQYVASDLNDDGTVNQVDYNIWLVSNKGAGANCSNAVCVYNKTWP